MEAIPDLPVDLAALAPDLALAPLPSEGAAPPNVPAASWAGMSTMMQQLEIMLRQAAEAGMLQQRPDGSFVKPGHVDPREAQIAEQGSECRCERCKSYDQQHWYCAGCYSGPFSWVAQPPRVDPHQILGAGGTTGKSWHFCDPQCKVNWRIRQQGHPGGLATASPQSGYILDQIPMAP